MDVPCALYLPLGDDAYEATARTVAGADAASYGPIAPTRPSRSRTMGAVR